MSPCATVSPARAVKVASPACLPLNVSNAVLERHPATPEEAVVQPSEPPEPTCVNEPVRGAVAVRVEVPTEPSVVRPAVLVKYARLGTAISDVVAISKAEGVSDEQVTPPEAVTADMCCPAPQVVAVRRVKSVPLEAVPIAEAPLPFKIPVREENMGGFEKVRTVEVAAAGKG